MPYRKKPEVAQPFALTVPFSVAPVVVIPLAGSVVRVAREKSAVKFALVGAIWFVAVSFTQLRAALAVTVFGPAVALVELSA